MGPSFEKAMWQWTVDVYTGKQQTTASNKAAVDAGVNKLIGTNYTVTPDPTPTTPTAALFNAYAPNAIYPKMRDQGRRSAAGAGAATSAVVSGNLGGNVGGLFGNMLSGFPGAVAGSRTTLLGG